MTAPLTNHMKDSWSRARKNHFYAELGRQIYDAREQAGLSAADVAKACHVATSTIAHIESGDSCSALLLVLIAEALDTPIDALVPLSATEKP